MKTGMELLMQDGKTIGEILEMKNAERDRLLADNKALREALEAMIDTHGMHGPCRNHSCSDCKHAYKQARAALAKVNACRTGETMKTNPLRTAIEQAEAQLAAERDKALEDAAKVCDEYARLDNPNAVTISTLSAKAIRALAAHDRRKKNG